ncbi:hypothetical protein NECAME_09912, partial [Necator americanus]
MKANGVSGNTVTRFNSSFQADEDIEDVIMKMSLTKEKSNTGQTIIAPDVELLGTASKSSLDSFYRIPVHKSVKKEKILTFCTKDVAIRDIRNMVIACGGEEDIWQPNRCPLGTDCLLSQDSTYRLCCPVYK